MANCCIMSVTSKACGKIRSILGVIIKFRSLDVLVILSRIQNQDRRHL